jgi:hypothetical protein
MVCEYFDKPQPERKNTKSVNWYEHVRQKPRHEHDTLSEIDIAKVCGGWRRAYFQGSLVSLNSP